MQLLRNCPPTCLARSPRENCRKPLCCTLFGLFGSVRRVLSSHNLNERGDTDKSTPAVSMIANHPLGSLECQTGITTMSFAAD
jgi:hypothetical protein